MSDSEDESLPAANADASQIAFKGSRTGQESLQSFYESTGRESRRQSEETNFSCYELLDVDRSALEAILDVSFRLDDIQKRSRVSMCTLTQAHESYKDKQVNELLN